jgi:steroid 5-alpha reductase family enzyme
MDLLTLYGIGLLLILSFMTAVWLLSLAIKKASIADPFWGLGFVVVAVYYHLSSPENSERKMIVLALVTLWGLRLFSYLLWRSYGQPEDYRYAQFRKDYGPNRYWWVSFFQVFVLQGILLWLISAPLLSAQYYNNHQLGLLDGLAIACWLIGFLFEAGGDYQLVKFKSNPANKGKVLNTGFWRFTRHPNYFGDACIWWGFALFSIAAGSYWPVLSSLLMTLLLLKVSGVAMLEKTLKTTKPEYSEYIRKTNSFFPWIPKR